MNKSSIGMMRQERGYIARLRRDPRTKAMHDGWLAQATYEAEQHYPYPEDARQRAHYAADRALLLALSFVLDNDGEMNALREQLDRITESSLSLLNKFPPAPIILKSEEDPK
ncbi:hypothetical protein [Novosphingobium clariflavum]|uniref:Phage protein n=1 Tax=Novosphingobium clariflavum TaxID=2029884 RepID=A0ABV6S376_9SPHN|nr:hypothetical protein [Novosphingobium clariflavum]